MPPSRRAARGSETPAVLHLTLGAAAFFLWAETGPGGRGPAEGSPPVAGGPDLDLGYPMHPRCLDPSALLVRLAGSRPTPVDPHGPRPSLTPLRPVDAAKPLPTVGGVPVPSPAAGGNPDALVERGVWGLSGLGLRIADADPWLRPFRVPGTLVGLGPEWSLWWRLAALVRRLVARGALVPECRDGVPGWHVEGGLVDDAVLEAIAAALPPVAMASPSFAEEMEGFVNAYADALVRRLAARTPELAPFRAASARGGARWLAAVLGPRGIRLDEAMEGDPGVAGWLADPAQVRGRPAVLLRVDEPAAEGPDAWPVRVFVELPHDPGVLTPLAEARAALGDRAEAFGLGRWGPPPAVERGLRRAARRAEALEDWDVDEAGGDLRLGAEAIWELVTVAREPLEAEGVRVVVPGWWTARPKARLRLRTAGAGAGLLSAEALVRFEWEVALGSATVSAEEFERLVRLRRPLVQVAGGWVVLPPNAARTLAARWAGCGPRGELPAGAALLLAIQAEADAAAETPGRPAGSEERDAEAVMAEPALLGELHALASGPAEAPEPPGFRGTLRPYQRRGLAWLQTRCRLGLGAILADDMGLGKTVQVLATIAARRVGGAAGPTLVVAPTSVVDNWCAEAERFVPGLTVLAHRGARRQLALAVVDAALVVTSYALLLRDAEALAQVQWGGVVLDEAQNVKNASTQQSQAARRLPARYRLALTGTPIENSLSDLWSIFAFVQPGYLGSREAFRRRLGGPVARGSAEAADTLQRLVRPLVLRRTKDDPLVAGDLPPRVEVVQRCPLTAEQAALYEAVARDVLGRIGESRGMRRRAAVLLALLRLKQVCDHPVLFARDTGPLGGRSGKLARLEDLLAEVAAEGDKALVFTQFAAWAGRLADHLAAVLPGVAVLRLDGSTPVAERPGLIRRFQESEGPAVFVLSLKAGGAGLNLTAARVVFHYDRWWNPAVERQATDRAHRIGQGRTVVVHKMVCPGTLEERIDQLIREKEALAASVLGGPGEAWLTELDDAALRDVLSLRRAALL